MLNEIIILGEYSSSFKDTLSRHFPLQFLEEGNAEVKGKVVVMEEAHEIALLYQLGAKAVYCSSHPEAIISEIKSHFNEESLSKPLSQYLQTKDSEYLARAERCLRFASNPQVPILLLGESGCGKTHFAKALHTLLRPKTPFVALNLLEFSRGTLESALFGHKKGAFTGATSEREGILARANGGTLFLDEIGALSLDLQRKLLKVIEEKCFYPLGSQKPVQVDFHLVSATCDDLKKKIEEEKFRADFYYRLSGHHFLMKPLRERTHDIELLLKSFQRSYSRHLHFTEEALASFRRYSWPGNVRELSHLFHKLQCQRSSVIHELTELKEDTLKKTLPEMISELESEVFKREFELHRGKPNKVCQGLGISKSVFYRLQEQIMGAGLTMINC